MRFLALLLSLFVLVGLAAYVLREPGSKRELGPTASLPAKRVVRFLAIQFNPKLSSGQGLREHMKWNDPRPMTRRLIAHLAETSAGYAAYEMVDFVEVDAFPRKRDGFRYDEQSFLEMWKDRSKAHQPDAVSYAAIFQELKLKERIQRENIDEVWIWGAPYFGTDEYAMKIPGDRLFYQTTNPWFYRPYDIPDCGRTIWVMGFNYEVGEDNALHSFGHRCEGVLALTVGAGVWDDNAGQENHWCRFTRQAAKFPDDAQVGNVHGGPNAKSGYDYGQKQAVMSGADDWYTYPDFKGLRKPVNCDTWGEPHHLNYMKWWLEHLPKNPGISRGLYHHWWRYVIDYDAAVRDLPPPEGKLEKALTAMY